jgi:preprotein translocase subunit SecG
MVIFDSGIYLFVEFCSDEGDLGALMGKHRISEQQGIHFFSNKVLQRLIWIFVSLISNKILQRLTWIFVSLF